MKNNKFQIRIGKAISIKYQSQITDLERFERYLYAKTFLLKTPLEINNIFKQSFRRSNLVAEPIIAPQSQIALKMEVDSIREKYSLFNQSQYNVFCAPSEKISIIMLEIGRLREITFREMGEGTNFSYDIDEFDLHYHQLFIWDEKEAKIVGAYRVGFGKDIFEKYGAKGFYLRNLFKINKLFHFVLEESIELGRSFIVKEYQRKPHSLFLLWKGILYLLLKNKEYRYLIGPVSISNNYPKLAKSLIVQFTHSKYFDKEMARYVKPRKQFAPNLKFIEELVYQKNVPKDFDELDEWINDIEEGMKTPILLKKYIKSVNAKIIGFNIDPKFNHCLDGFVLLDIYQIPDNIIETFAKDVDDQSIIQRFMPMKASAC